MAQVQIIDVIPEEFILADLCDTEADIANEPAILNIRAAHPKQPFRKSFFQILSEADHPKETHTLGESAK